MKTLEEVARNRLERSRVSGAGSDVDQEFDAVFAMVLDDPDTADPMRVANLARPKANPERIDPIRDDVFAQKQQDRAFPPIPNKPEML